MRNRFFYASVYLLASLAIFFAISVANAGDSTSFNPTDVAVKADSFGGVPIGTPVPSFSLHIPKGYLECNGQSFSKTTYPKLSLALNGATKVPDLRGVYLRGVDDGRGLDPGRKLGSYKGTTGSMRLVRETKDVSVYRHGYPRDPAQSRYPIHSTINIGDTTGWSNWGVTSAATKVSYHDGTGSHGSGNPIQDDYTYAVRFKMEGLSEGGPPNVATMYIIRAK